MDRKRIQDDLKLKVFEKGKEVEKNSTKQTDKLIERSEAASSTLKKDMLTQNEQLKQRLAARKSSRVRANSAGDQSMSLNFGRASLTGRDSSVEGHNAVSLRKITSD